VILHAAMSSPPPSSSRKRRRDDGSKPRKRFVWPDRLHKDFIAAVFDVGLKSASPLLVHQMFPEGSGSADAVTVEQVKGHLQKFRLHRLYQRYQAHNSSAAEGPPAIDGTASDVAAPAVSGSSPVQNAHAVGESIRPALDQQGHNTPAEPAGGGGPGVADMGADVEGTTSGMSTQRIVETLGSLRQQAQLVKHSLELLARFGEEIHSAVVTQKKLYKDLQDRIDELGAMVPEHTQTGAGGVGMSSAGLIAAGSPLFAHTFANPFLGGLSSSLQSKGVVGVDSPLFVPTMPNLPMGAHLNMQLSSHAQAPSNQSSQYQGGGFSQAQSNVASSTSFSTAATSGSFLPMTSASSSDAGVSSRGATSSSYSAGQPATSVAVSAASSHSNSSGHGGGQSAEGSIGDGGDLDGATQRAQMELEMQSHMSMHRTMMLHMEGQLAQYAPSHEATSSVGGAPGPSVAADAHTQAASSQASAQTAASAASHTGHGGVRAVPTAQGGERQPPELALQQQPLPQLLQPQPPPQPQPQPPLQPQPQPQPQHTQYLIPQTLPQQPPEQPLPLPQQPPLLPPSPPPPAAQQQQQDGQGDAPPTRQRLHSFGIMEGYDGGGDWNWVDAAGELDEEQLFEFLKD